ncbi:MAG: hypothetical protein JSS20_02375 [Proteobacteria bacterium]|nr:hypothetical protein [Pseudomonadota bacterium]
MSEVLRGSCHCGNIAVTFRWPADRHEIPARACDCEFCLKHGGRWTSNPDGGFTLTVADQARETIYRFGTKTADFHVCATCGVVPIVTCELDGRRYAVVNVNTFVGVDAGRLVVRGISFEDEEPGDRLARREKTWTPESQK